MFCSKCGNQINDEAVICPNCGCPTNNHNQNINTTIPTQSQMPPTRNYDSEVSNVKLLGLISIIAGIFIPLAGWICGGIGLSKCNKLLTVFPNDLNIENAKKQNIAGIIVASVIFVLAIIVEVVAILMIDLI